MRILVHGRFHPGIGGIETIVNLLAHEWTATGSRVVVVSNASCDRYDRREFPFAVFYRPGPLRWLRLVRWADLVLHMNLSLKVLWPHLVLRRPILISHQSCYRKIGPIRPIGLMNWRRSLKLFFMRRASNIAASRAIAHSIAIPCKIIPNPYDNKLFNPLETVPRDRELIFVGRLVSEKGVDLLLNAFKQLEPHWPAIRLTIIGDGPERSRLAAQAARLGLGERIHFLGALAQREVARELRRHKILVVPSTYEEPFGVVALEGAACGCAVVGSDRGGLPDAIGPTGRTFRRGDVNHLTSQLLQLLAPEHQTSVPRDIVVAHLERHHPARIAAEYVRIFQTAARAPRTVSCTVQS